MLCLGKESSKAEITSQEKRNQDFMVGFQEEAVNKRKVVKLKVVGLLVELVKIKGGQNLVEEQMLLKEQSEDVDQLVPLVKHIRDGRELNELVHYSQKG